MPLISITKTYQDGDILTEQDLDNMRDDVTNFMNVTKIDSDNIQDGGILTAKIGDAQVVEAKIGVDAVTTVKIKDDNVTEAKLNSALQYNKTKANGIGFSVFGFYGQRTLPLTDVDRFRMPFNVTLTDVQLFVGCAGTSGTLEIDVQRKVGAGAWTSIFSTTPQLASGAGDLATSSNQVLSITTLNEGDFVRLDILDKQIGNREFDVRFIG